MHQNSLNEARNELDYDKGNNSQSSRQICCVFCTKKRIKKTLANKLSCLFVNSQWKGQKGKLPEGIWHDSKKIYLISHQNAIFKIKLLRWNLLLGGLFWQSKYYTSLFKNFYFQFFFKVNVSILFDSVRFFFIIIISDVMLFCRCSMFNLIQNLTEFIFSVSFLFMYIFFSSILKSRFHSW